MDKVNNGIILLAVVTLIIVLGTLTGQKMAFKESNSDIT